MQRFRCQPDSSNLHPIRSCVSSCLKKGDFHLGIELMTLRREKVGKALAWQYHYDQKCYSQPKK